MFKEWNAKPQLNFMKSYKKIDWLIEVVKNIRSTKVTLNILPGEFIDISTVELNRHKRLILFTVQNGTALVKYNQVSIIHLPPISELYYFYIQGLTLFLPARMII